MFEGAAQRTRSDVIANPPFFWGGEAISTPKGADCFAASRLAMTSRGRRSSSAFDEDARFPPGLAWRPWRLCGLKRARAKIARARTWCAYRLTASRPSRFKHSVGAVPDVLKQKRCVRSSRTHPPQPILSKSPKAAQTPTSTRPGTLSPPRPYRVSRSAPAPAHRPRPRAACRSHPAASRNRRSPD